MGIDQEACIVYVKLLGVHTHSTSALNSNISRYHSEMSYNMAAHLIRVRMCHGMGIRFSNQSDAQG